MTSVDEGNSNVWTDHFMEGIDGSRSDMSAGWMGHGGVSSKNGPYVEVLADVEFEIAL